MSIQKVEMTVEQKENGQYVEQVAYPYVEYDHITMENGMDIMSMIRDDVSTPMVTHNTTSWKVGQGDSDVSETIVDSSVGDMTIKGQTYQNILPSPSLRNSMTNGKTMQKLNEGYDSVEVVDGNVKSAILKGQTLVNLFPIDEVRKALPADWKESSKGVFEYTSSSTARDSVTGDITLTQPLIAGKTYVLKHDSDNTTDCASIGFIFPNETTGIWYQGAFVSSGTLKPTQKSVIYTPNKDIKTVRMGRWDGNYVQNTTVNIKYPMILEHQEGMENWDIPYFEGMQSVKMPVLTTSNEDGTKTNILSTPEEVVLRSLPNGVKDTLNLNTGVYTQRIKTLTLNGSEDWFVLNNTVLRINVGDGLFDNDSTTCLFCDKMPITMFTNYSNPSYDGYLYATNDSSISAIQHNRTLDEWKAHLQSNPITVQYQLATESVKTVDLSVLDQDNQPVAQLNSFANGYVQVSSQGLIPSVDYEAPTSNSYYVDLMKPNTQYTMKNMQGTFTIDGIQYNASVNGTFTSPSTLSNRLMITNVVQTQPMLLEGDMTSKEVPYVEGIKSAFEGADRVEIYSVGKNVLGYELEIGTIGTDGNLGNLTTNTRTKDFIPVLPNKKYYTLKMENDGITTGMRFYDINKKLISTTSLSWEQKGTFTTPQNCYFIKFIRIDSTNLNAKYMFGYSKFNLTDTYEPYKSNTTSFPITNPLRSLPNGERDEIVLDRMSNKAKLIQRVGGIVLDGSEDEGWVNHSGTKYKMKIHTYGKNHGGTVNCISDTLIPQTYSNCILLNNIEGVAVHYDYLGINNHEFDKDLKGFKQWLSENPITIHYELATPITTEVNLEGYPYVYKDGRISLNTEIAPITEVTYSINQAHQIESSNEDILRHQKEINHLYELIAQYVQVQYEAELIDIALQG